MMCALDGKIMGGYDSAQEELSYNRGVIDENLNEKRKDADKQEDEKNELSVGIPREPSDRLIR